MMMNVRCQDKERLIAYLYDEQSAEERDLVEAHLAECRACTEEIAELRGVRQQLMEWQPPHAELGFRIVKEPATPPRQRSWIPAWAALPAAAMVVLAVSAAIANVEVRYDADGVMLRTGWSQTSQAGTVPVSSQSSGARIAATSAEDPRFRTELAALERRLRAEFARPSSGRTTSTGVAVNGDELLRQMRALVAESEARQQRELAIRFTQLVQDVESQRRADLVQIEQNIEQIEGLTAQQGEITRHLMRVSDGR